MSAWDPAVRWQVERDLLGDPPSVWEVTRARTATEGFGARLLAHQDDDGQWAGGAYFPAADTDGEVVIDAEGDPDAAGAQPWTATTWSLTFLREWGVPAAALGDTADRLAVSSRWEYDDLPYWGGEVDCCINAFTLANGAWLGTDVDELADWFPAHQLADGGWNCEWVEGSTRSSFHSTLNVVRGLLAHELLTGSTALRASRLRGQEYLLQRHLLHRASTGELVGPWVTRIAHPFLWVATALGQLDHLRTASLHDGAAPDPRAAEAVARVRAARRPDGTWLQERRDPGAVWFHTDVPAGEPSPWLTLIGTRVLDWWDAGTREA
ncbi:squalene cyclase [Serinibacter arcticus]|uniref:Squalene cyclase n=1 Tax=Serinibacter arcticus TaxID=1655435 RepID=A0A2U1ZZ41_9MICO|nr:squalene cyclase [Serinibacter arcticus]PWD52256.1 squalene cyclase [Serinibacter arcticus]